MNVTSVDGKKRGTIKKRSKTKTKKITSKNVKTENTGVTTRIRRKKKYSRKGKGVIYLGHIPHGFYEDEMESYFNQFGKVLTTTVARSPKTGRSKGYGFVEFLDEEVAKVAAETMNNYLMFNKILKCRYIPPKERRGKMFVRSITCNDYPRKKNRIENLKNKLKGSIKLNEKTYMNKIQKKINEFTKFFEDRGIDFTFKIANEKEIDQKDKNSKNETNVALQVSSESEPANETDDQYGVLEIDESDNEINFKTPPKVKKVIKKCLNSPVTSSNEFNNFVKDSPIGIKVEGKRLKNEVSEKIQKIDRNKKKNQKTRATGTNKSEKRIKSKGKSLKDSKKLEVSEKNVSSLIKQGNVKVKGNIDVVISKISKPVSRER